MTNKERLISLIGFAPDNQNAIEGALLDASIDPDGDYEAGNLKVFKKATIEVIDILLSTPDTSNPQSGMSIKYDRPSLLARRKILMIEIGEEVVPVPTIDNKSYRW